MNNRGFSQVIIFIVIFTILAGFTYYYFNFFNINEDSITSANIVESKYHSIGNIKFKLPSLSQNEINNFIDNNSNRNCFNKDYFNGINILVEEETNFEFSIYSLPENTLCPRDSGNYPVVYLYSASSSPSNYYYDLKSYNWELDSELTNENFSVHSNKNLEQTTGKEFFLVNRKDNAIGGDEIIIGITPAPKIDEINKNLEYNYIKKLINNFEKIEQNEFKGKSSCKDNECNSLKIYPGLNSIYSHILEKTYTVRTYKIVLKDTISANEYYVEFPESKIKNNEVLINNIVTFEDKVVFEYQVADVTYLNNTKSIHKIAILDLNTGKYRDLIVNPANLSFQSFLVDGDFIYYSVGLTCLDSNCSEDKTQKVIYRYDFRSNKIIQLTDKNLTNYGLFKDSKILEKDINFKILKAVNNKLLVRIVNLNDENLSYTYFYYDMTLNEFKEIPEGTKVSEENREQFESKITL